jgi:hypothetical protein
MSKFLLNFLVQISKGLVYSKIKFYLEKNFSQSLLAHPAFRPSLFFLPTDFPSPSHWASAFRPAQPTRTVQPATFFLPPAPKPRAHGAAAGRARAASTVAPMPPPEEKNGRI